MTDDIVTGPLTDGPGPPPEPSAWECLHMIQTSEPCPACGIAIAALVGPQSRVTSKAKRMADDYPISVPDGWADSYTHPVFVYCDRPACDWCGAVEWRQFQAVWESWIDGDAPTWAEAESNKPGEHACIACGMESTAHSHYIIQPPEVVTEFRDDEPEGDMYVGICHGCWFGYIGGPSLVESGDLTPKIDAPDHTAYEMSEQFKEALLSS